MLEKLKNVKNEKELQELGYQIIYRSNKRKVGTNVNKLIDEHHIGSYAILRNMGCASSYVSIFRRITENPESITVKEALLFSRIFNMPIEELFYLKNEDYKILKNGDNKIYLDLANFEFISEKEMNKRIKNNDIFYDNLEKKVMDKSEYERRYKEEVIIAYSNAVKKEKIRKSFVLRDKLTDEFYERYTSRFAEVGKKIEDIYIQ